MHSRLLSELNKNFHTLSQGVVGFTQDLANETNERTLESSQFARNIQFVQGEVKELARDMASEASAREAGDAESARHLAASAEQQKLGIATERLERDRERRERDPLFTSIELQLSTVESLVAGCTQDLANETNERTLESSQFTRNIQFVQDKIKEVAHDLASEASAREAGDAESARHLAASAEQQGRQLEIATGQERRERDRLFTSIEVQLSTVESEKEACLSEEAPLRRALEGQYQQHLEAMKADSLSLHSSLEKLVHEFRNSLGEQIASNDVDVQGLKYALKSVQDSFEQDSTRCARLNSEFNKNFNTLSQGLEAESKERAAADEEASRLNLEARRLVESECRSANDRTLRCCQWRIDVINNRLNEQEANPFKAATYYKCSI